jgi:hypothetical protein
VTCVAPATAAPSLPRKLGQAKTTRNALLFFPQKKSLKNKKYSYIFIPRKTAIAGALNCVDRHTVDVLVGGKKVGISAVGKEVPASLSNEKNKNKNLRWLTPKIPYVFGPIFAVSDLVGGFHFSTKKKM